MAILLWDASGLTKRYAAEPGTDSANALWDSVPSEHKATTTLTYTETYATIVRKHNSGAINEAGFEESSSALKLKIIRDLDFILLDLFSGDFIDATDYVCAHNINASDAVILSAFLRFAAEEEKDGTACVVIASDVRLIRAARSEGLHTLNPSEIDPSDILSVLSTLGCSTERCRVI